MAIQLRIIEIDNMATVQVIVQGGIIQTSNSLNVISGFIVQKGAGNTAGTIEVGDYITGWLSDVYVAGKVLTIPVTDVSDLDTAVQGEIF